MGFSTIKWKASFDGTREVVPNDGPPFSPSLSFLDPWNMSLEAGDCKKVVQGLMVEWERYCYIRQIINSFSDQTIFENNLFMHRNNHAIFLGPLKNHQFVNFLNTTEKKLKQPLFCYPLFRNFICNESSQNEPTSLPGWAWLTWDSVMWSTFGHQLLYYRTLQFTVFSSRP